MAQESAQEFSIVLVQQVAAHFFESLDLSEARARVLVVIHEPALVGLIAGCLINIHFLKNLRIY